MSKNQGREDRPKVHSYTARSRSPTVIADGFRQKKGSSESMSSTWSHVSQKDRSENQEPFFSKYQHPVSPDNNTEADDEIIITLDYRDHNNQQHFVDIRRACTVEEYMQWMFILNSAILLDQFNVNLKKELDISLVLTSESVIHVGRTSLNVESVLQTCNQIVGIELKSLGKKLGLIKTDLHPDQIERYIVELGISAQAKALKGHVYFVFMKGDHKKVTEYIEKLENCRREEEMIDKPIVTHRIWIKVAKLINLDQILTGHCKCMDLIVTFHPRKENCILSLTGPRRAVELAAIEFNNLNQRLHHQNCELSVTSKTALSELHMESFLDELLLNNGIRCVTEQRKDKIFVYGLSEDCIKKAKKEVEAVIIEKTSIIQGQLKQKKQLLISCLKSRRPKEIVIHVEDSGLLHITGLKVFVEETCQRLNDIKEGRIRLEAIDSGEKYGTKIEDVVTMTLSDGQIEQKLTVNDDRILSKETPSHSLNDNIYTHHWDVAGKKEGEIVEKYLTTEQDIARQSGKGEVSQVQEVMDNTEDTEKMSVIYSGASGPLNRYVRHTRDQSAHLTKKPELLDRKLGQTLKDGNSKLESETLKKSYDYEAEHVVENMQFSDKKIKQFLVKSEARTFLKECSDEHNVIICQHIDYGTVEKIKRIEFITMAPEKGIKYRCSWETMDQKKMILAVDGGIENNIGVVSRAVSVVFGHPKRNKEPVSLVRKMDHGIVVKVRVPNYFNGKYQEKRQLMDTLTRLFEVLEEANVEHVILPLDAVHDWPSTDFISCVISQTVQALLFKQISEKPYSVLLSLNDESLYEPAFQRTCKCVNKCVADQKAKRKRLQVVVVKGELDKTKADVIVNTTSRDLNLSNGKVSETLLKAAGSHLQRECSERYPNGIARLEIAVTDGYKLCCDNVFHIALDRYHPHHEKDSIETIRCLMMKCFKTASEHGHRTIAFPAIGTGILKYPSDLVAAAMFESVERFKFDYPDTSLEQIFFVIYPSDVRVLKDFMKNEETLGKHLEEQRNRWYEIQLKITGTSENVQRAKSDILERCQDEIANTSEVCEEYSDVTLQDYVALCELHKKDIKAIKANGIHISHQQNKLTLTGKRKSLKKVSQQIGKYLKDVNKYRCVSLSVKGYEHHVIESMVEQENQKKSSKDLFCIFDKYYELIRIFTKAASMEKAVRKSLTDKLKLGPDGHSVSIKTSETVHVDGKALEASSSDSADFYKRERNAVSLLDEHNRKHLFDKNMNVEEERKDKTESLDVLGSYHSEMEERGVNAYDQHLMRKKNSQDERVFNTNDILVLVYTGDILCSDVDCIVSPANQDLNHCGGLASAIAKAAGDGLIKHCEYFVKDGPLSVSTVVSTPSGQLKYKCILQAVGPCWSDYRPITEKSLKQCQDDLKQTVINCLKKADESGMNLIALPTISSGLFGVPKELCAIEYAKAILEFGGKTQSLSEIHLVDTDPGKIKLIQEIFTAMINHGKPLMINMKDCIEASASNDESVPHMKKSKYTGRDKPKGLGDLRKEPVSEGTDTDHFYLKENKMVCRFSSSHYLHIYEEDFLQMQDIQAVVCCNNSSDGGKDEIPKKLSESGKQEYEADRSEYSKGKLDNSNVVTTDSGKKECEADRSEHSKGKLENSNVASTDSGKKEYEADRSEHSKGKLENSNAVTTDGGESNFEYTINVVTPKDDRAQHLMYIHVFDEVVKKGISCVAMPLLEIGGVEGYDHKESVVVFLREWINFIHNCKSHPLTLHLVLNDKQTTDLVTDVLKDYFEEEARFEDFLGKQQKLGTHDERIQDISPDTTLQRTTDVEQDLDCVICLDKIHSPKKLKCGHQFCKDCIEGYFKVKPTCPVCGQICGVVTGDQPDGTMEIVKIKCSCAGYEKYKSIAVSYFFPSGHQKECNPRPGAYYRSISRTGYLPDNKEGREVCALMKVAFERRLTFTIGTSRTTLEEGVITWNDIHHKTDLRPHTQFGYPDETYLQRVREEMEVKGVTAEDIDKNFMKELEKERYSCKVSTSTSL